MNLKQYADHRKSLGLRGQSHVAVINAIKDGRLSEPAVVRNGNRWVIDAALADQQWGARTNPEGASTLPTEISHAIADPHAPPSAADPVRVAGGATPGPNHRAQPEPAVSTPPHQHGKQGPSLNMSKQVKAAYDAKLTELEYRQRNGELGSIADMRTMGFGLAKATREAVLAVPPRICAELASIRDDFACEQLLERELIDALRTLEGFNG